MWVKWNYLKHQFQIIFYSTGHLRPVWVNNISVFEAILMFDYNPIKASMFNLKNVGVWRPLVITSKKTQWLKAAIGIVSFSTNRKNQILGVDDIRRTYRDWATLCFNYLLPCWCSFSYFAVLHMYVEITSISSCLAFTPLQSAGKPWTFSSGTENLFEEGQSQFRSPCGVCVAGIAPSWSW